MSYTEIQNQVVKMFNVKLDPNSKCWSRTHVHVRERRICKWVQKNSIQSTFTLFHEIGHIETSKAGMRRCEDEFAATQWAIVLCAVYGLEIPEKTINDYQDYIFREWDRGVRRGGKLPPKENFTLYSPAEYKTFNKRFVDFSKNYKPTGTKRRL